MPSKVVVTGATGYMGGHLTRRLLSTGAEVAVVVRDPSRVPEWMAAHTRVISTTNGVPRWTRAVTSFAPDACFHLAAQSIQVHAPETIAPLLDANVVMGTHLLEALAGVGGVRVVNVGSMWQHHDSRPYGPSSLYAATKQAFVDILQFFAECSDVRSATVEFPDTYGPEDGRRKLLSLLVEASRSGEPLRMSPGGQIIEVIHIDDVVEALLATLAVASHDNPSFRATGEVLKLREFVDLVSLCLGAAVPVEWGARPYRPRETMEPWNHFPPVPDWERQRSVFVELPTALATAGTSHSSTIRIPAQTTVAELVVHATR